MKILQSTKLRNHLISAVLTCTYVFFVWFGLGIYFETNDDRVMTEMLAGLIVPEPDGHLVYVNYLLGSLLAGLYRLTAAVPWYGGCMILFHGLCCFFIAESVLEYCESKRELLGAVILLAAGFGGHLYLLAQLQFTSTTGLLAITGYFCLILQKHKKKRLGLFFLFEFLSMMMRDQAMLMIQPLGAMVWACLVLTDKEKSWKERWLLGFWSGGLVVLAIGIGLLGNAIGYRSEGWEDYNRYNDANVVMYDYYGMLDYETAKPILDKHGVTEAEYVAYLNFIILDWDLSIECVEDLAAFVEENSDKSVDVGKILQEMYEHTVGDSKLWINRLALGMYVFSLVWLLFRKNYRLLLPVGALGAATMVVLGYLIYRGRTPYRVLLPVYVCETALLAALLLYDYKNKELQKVQKGVWLTLCGMACLLSLYAGKCQYDFVKPQNEAHEIYIVGMRELEEYCRNHPENRYLIEAKSLLYYRGSALETDIYRERNSIGTGSWYSNSPTMRAKLAEYFGDCEGFYYVLYDDGMTRESAGMRFLAESTGKEGVEVDRFSVTPGGVYVIYYFER